MEGFVLSVFSVLFASLIQNLHASPYVLLNGSLFIGERISFAGTEVHQYLGVPYAQPPVGDLRFKKPVPLSGYPPVVLALTNPPACQQYSQNPYPWYTNSSFKSEDCLYMNIWTPADASPTNKKAVMFWMHGGGYKLGSIVNEVFSGIPLSSKDIVVVTVGYRLGAFGFLQSGSDDAPGNVGLYDLLEGLKWVNKHIEAFGGDVAKITIAGESAGSFTVSIFATSPLAKGLYKRQIMQSGSLAFRHVDNNTQNIAISQQLAKSVGCATDTFTIKAHPEEVVQCLRGIDDVSLSVADYFVAPVDSINYYPQWGDDLIPNNPRESIFKGDFECTDLIIGNNKDEGSLIPTTTNRHLYGFFGEKDPHINRSLGEETILAGASLYPPPQSIVDHYLPANLTDDSHYRIRHQAYTARGDLILKCPTVYYAEKCAEQGRNVYYYVFTHRPSVTPWAPWMGVAHYEEVQFVFGEPILRPEKYLPSEVVLSQQIVDIWTSFVKYGTPNVSWPLYSKEDPAFKYIGVTETNDENEPDFSCDFLRPFFGL